MALSFLYRLLRSLIELGRVHRMDAIDKDAEILVLRQSWLSFAVRSPGPASLGRTRLRRLKHEGPGHEVALGQFLPYIA